MIIAVKKQDIGNTYKVGGIEYTVENIEDKGSYLELTLSDIGIDSEVDIEEVLKEEQLKKLTVTTSKGITFYADPESRVDIVSAIKAGEDAGIDKTVWKTPNGLIETTLDELREVNMLALKTKAEIVGVENG